MNKKLFFIITIIISLFFIEPIYAENINNLEKKWEVRDEEGYQYDYMAENHYLRFSSTGFVSYDKFTGEKKEVEFEDGAYTYHYYENNQILVISTGENTANAKIYLYDDNLNVIKETDLGNLIIDYCKNLDSNYIIVSGNITEGNGMNRIVYYLDHQGNIYKQHELLTISSTHPYREYFESGKDVFADEQNNTYYLDNYKIVPYNLNADGTYTILKSNKLIKYDTNGTKITEVTIPNAKDTKIAKYNGKYYLESGIYTKEPDPNSNNTRTYIRLRIHLYDEGLNLLNTVELPQNEESYTLATTIGYSRGNHSIGVKNNQVYATVMRMNSSYDYTYNLNEDLTYTTEIKRNEQYGVLFLKSYLSNNQYKFPYYTKDDSVVKKIIKKKNNNQQISNVYYKKDGNNYIASILYEKHDGYDNDYKEYNKLELVYYDSKYNEIFSKLIYDWTLTQTNSCNGQIVANAVDILDNYIVLLANNNEENFFIIYDRAGNQVRDLTSDINDPYLSFHYVFSDPNGIFVEFSRQDYMCEFGVTQDNSQDGEVLPEILTGDEDRTVYHMLYYEFGSFLVKTKVIGGGGSIHASENSAREGAEVTFTITPDEGYVLGSVKVTDANGNTVIFNGNTFTMPSSDVLIEAEFVLAEQKVNPNTSDIAIATIFLITIAAGTIYIIQKKKFNFLK